MVSGVVAVSFATTASALWSGPRVPVIHCARARASSSSRIWAVPARVVSLLHYLFTEVLDGRNAYLTDGVQRALGREPRDFAQYAREAGASGVWDG